MSNGGGVHVIPDYSVWGDDFNMEAFRTNPARWNKDWERALSSRTAAEVFIRLANIHLKKSDKMNTEEIIPMLSKQMVALQEALVKLWDSVEELGGHFLTAWVLLDVEERTRHLNKGFEDSYARVADRQDARCYTPEIMLSALMKQSGQVFLDLVQAFVKGKREVGAGKPYFHPSVWWDKVLEGVPESFLDGMDELALDVLTLHRNDFLTKYLTFVIMSVFHDLRSGSPGMDPVTDLMSSDPITAESLAKAASGIHDEPVVRCQNCTSTQADGGPKYMMCSTCKSKLNFPIHYCSAKCQREDWHSHKKHCGKEKTAKHLPGTIHDPFWFQPDVPDSLRHISTSDSGNVDLISLGFGNAKNIPSYSAALQRQVNLLTADKIADYFLFDEMDRPVRFVIADPMLKAGFRIMRTDAFSSGDPQTVEGMVEHIIKHMSQRPGLSRERIIAQFTREYKRDIAGKLAMHESVSEGGRTAIESVSRGMTNVMVPHHYER